MRKIAGRLLPLMVVVGTMFCNVVLTGLAISGFFTEHNHKTSAVHPDIIEMMGEEKIVSGRATVRTAVKFHYTPKPATSPVVHHPQPEPLSYSGIPLSSFSKQAACYGLLFLQYLF